MRPTTIPRDRRGFTLVELLVALIMLVVVGGAMYSVMLAVQRTTRTQTEMAALHSNLRAGMQIVASDMLELFADSAAGVSDITSSPLSATSMSYNAVRGSGIVCERSNTAVRIQRDASWTSFQGPLSMSNTKGVLIFADQDPDLAGDDTWIDRTITAVAAGTCPDGITPAWVLSVTLDDFARDSILKPAPVRTYEEMQLGILSDLGRNWLGLRSVTGGEATLQPIAGPLTSDGLTLQYFLSDGATTTTNPAHVKLINIRLKGETDRPVNAGLGGGTLTKVDSLNLRIQLRNAR